MALIEQIGELLSQPPGSVIFHLLTLFALQVVLALAYVRWRRDPNDEAARRMMIAAGGILVARLVLLVVGVYVSLDPTRPSLFLPPLEQALDTATVALLVWGLVAAAPERPRLADAVLLVTLVITAVMFLFFLQDWRSRANTGIAYTDTAQSTLWTVLQIAILTAGFVASLLDRRYRTTLRPFILGVPLLAHITQQWLIPAGAPLGLELSGVVRLGYLVAFPLWAVLAYRENISNLVTTSEAQQDSSVQLTRTLSLGTSVLGTRIPQLRLEHGLDMIMGLIPTQFATIGLIDESDPQRVVFNHYRPVTAQDTAHGWQMNLTDRSALRLAYEQQRGLELLPHGVGARQVHELSQQFNTGPLGPVFIQPLMVNGRCLGFLVLAAPAALSTWSDQDRALAPATAAFLAQAIANSRQLEDEIAARVAATTETHSERELHAENERLRAEVAALSFRVGAEMPIVEMPPVPAADDEKTPVVPIIEEAISLVLPVIRDKRLQLDLAVPKDLPAVPVREEVLQQLVVSLLDNAVRASVENSSMMLRADLAATNGGSTAGRILRITIADSGGGIRDEDRERVFDSQYHVLGGKPISGLGDNSANMAVVQALAQASGGNISLKSAEGQGTVFALSLPTTALWTPETAQAAGADKTTAAAAEAAAAK